MSEPAVSKLGMLCWIPIIFIAWGVLSVLYMCGVPLPFEDERKL